MDIPKKERRLSNALKEALLEKHSREFKPPKVYQNRRLVLSELIDARSNKTKVNVVCAYQKSSIQNLFGLHLGIQSHGLAASGGKYKLISEKYFVSETV